MLVGIIYLNTAIYWLARVATNLSWGDDNIDATPYITLMEIIYMKISIYCLETEETSLFLLIFCEKLQPLLNCHCIFQLSIGCEIVIWHFWNHVATVVIFSFFICTMLFYRMIYFTLGGDNKWISCCFSLFILKKIPKIFFFSFISTCLFLFFLL